MDSLQTMNELMQLTPDQLKLQIDKIPVGVFVEGGKALIKFYRDEQKKIEKKKKEYAKGYDAIITSAEIIIKKSTDLTTEEKFKFLDIMRQANAEKVALLKEADDENNGLRKVLFAIGGGGLLLLGAYIIGKKIK